jgi:hypothetical protein
MKPDIVVVPTFSRPEYLWLCLERIAACPESRMLDICVYVDNHENRVPAPKDEIERVTTKCPGLSIYLLTRAPHRFIGNSFNVLEAYREAYGTGCEYVFQVEDDVMVTPDFFTWHYRVQRSGRWFCSVGCKSPRVPPPEGADDFYGTVDFCSYGVCFPRNALATVIQHARPEYYGNMDGYIGSNFPDLGFAGRFTEQDGLIHRLVKMSGLPSAWPVKPRSCHCGYYGYHRGKGLRPEGTLEQRYEQVKKIIASADELRRNSRDYDDLEALDDEIIAGR